METLSKNRLKQLATYKNQKNCDEENLFVVIHSSPYVCCLGLSVCFGRLEPVQLHAARMMVLVSLYAASATNTPTAISPALTASNSSRKSSMFLLLRLKLFAFGRVCGPVRHSSVRFFLMYLMAYDMGCHAEGGTVCQDPACSSCRRIPSPVFGGCPSMCHTVCVLIFL